MMRIKFALVLVLLGGPAFLISEQVLSANIKTKPGRRITLVNRRHPANHHNYEKASVSFRYGLAEFDVLSAERDDRDMLYGAFNYKGDSDWFTVTLGGGDRSSIKDLGKMDWSDDIVVPVLPILPCPANESCHPVKIPSPSSGKTILDVNPHMAKPVVGHMYVVHTHDRERDLYRSDFSIETNFYTLFRVEELKPNESCTISWKRIPTPKK
jgi:hypothetical protein